MEQFSLEKYLANPSRKVVTRDGRNARIICTDRRDINRPIVALIEEKLGEEEIETIRYYTKDGELDSTGYGSGLDLFFAPEKHEGWVNIYQGKKVGELYYRNVFRSEKEARQMRDKEAIATAKIEWEE